MTHPRLIPSNGRVALEGWSGQADRFVDGEVRQVMTSVADLRRKPEGALDCQLLYGNSFLVLEDRNGWSFGQAKRDGYVGYVRTTQLKATEVATHKLTALASHVYTGADMKSGTQMSLPFGSRLSGAVNGDFLALISGGYVPAQHCKPFDSFEHDFVARFESFLGIPYLWGGNSVWGMDCSGALQLALHAAGRDCPRDTDMQVVELGVALADGALLRRGDLIFWRGHVGVMLDTDILIHANAHHMAVAIEPLADAITRIENAGDGSVTARRRL